MKRTLPIIQSLFLSLVISLMVALPAVAQKDAINRLTNVGGAAGYGDQVTTKSIATTVGQIIQAFLSILGVIFMAYIIYAGYLWLSAKGNDEQITKAKAILRGSIIGLIIVLAGYAITGFVITRLTTATGFRG